MSVRRKADAKQDGGGNFVSVWFGYNNILEITKLAQRTYTASVTFEYTEKAPDTYRGEISAGKAETASHRALKAAKAKYPGARPSSIVVLLDSHGHDN